MSESGKKNELSIESLMTRMPSERAKQDIATAKKEIERQSRAAQDIAQIAKEAAKLTKKRKDELVKQVSDDAQAMLAVILGEGIKLKYMIILEAQNILATCERDEHGHAVIPKEKMELVKQGSKLQKELEDRNLGGITQRVENKHEFHISQAGFDEYAHLDADVSAYIDIIDVDEIEDKDE